MKRQTASAVDSRLAKALAHPLRVQLLAALNEGVASPNELAKRLDEPLTNVSYHVRMLHDLGCIELVETEPRRGALEHYYRAVVRPFFSDRDWKRIPRSGREAISGTALRVIWEDVADAVKGGTFDARPDRHLTHNPMTLDDEGWDEVARVMSDALAKVEKIESQSAGRLKKSKHAGIPARVVFMQFEAPDDSTSTNGPPQHAQKS